MNWAVEIVQKAHFIIYKLMVQKGVLKYQSNGTSNLGYFDGKVNSWLLVKKDLSKIKGIRV